MHLPPRALLNLRRRLLGWFRAHRRDLPWRRSRDPYRIWVAEIMLQQTRIAAVLPYYHRFLRRFPHVTSVARAREEEVLKHWAGLGYYGRARNLHRAAKEIVAEHRGRFPRELDSALRLPGVGRYTAAAVLSIAYDAPYAVVDGNVARVLARLGALRGDLRAPIRRRELEGLAAQLLDPQAAGDWNQALMELGETVCTPRAPRCEACPLSRWCQARAKGFEEQIPAPRKKRKPVHIRIAAAVLLDPQGRTLLVRDPGEHHGELFSQMWQFPAIEVAHDASTELAANLQEKFEIRAEKLEALPVARHTVTWHNITLQPFLARVSRLPEGKRRRMQPLERLANLPVSSATRKIATAALARLAIREAHPPANGLPEDQGARMESWQ